MGQLLARLGYQEENEHRGLPTTEAYGRHIQNDISSRDTTQARIRSGLPAYESALERFISHDEHAENNVAVQSRTTRSVTGSGDFYTKNELQTLLFKAERYIRRYNSKTRLSYFYRDKNEAYYDDIISKNEGIMQVYMKDFHGDPKSPINGRLTGLFMSVNVQHGTSEPVFSSVYGEKRLLLDPETMYQRCPNLYFTDFYCIHKPHYVTLVMTSPGSEADRFCQRHLIKLEWHSNPFLERRCEFFEAAPSYYVINCGLWVEVFFTEDIDVLETTKKTGPLFDVEMKGYRSGGTVGLKKNAYCSICNI